MKIFALLFVFPFFTIEKKDLNSFSAQVACKPVDWVTKPVVVKDLFKGDLIATCTFRNATGGGVKAANDSLEDALEASDIVHQGPVSETFENLSSVFYEVSRTTVDSAGSLTVRSENHLASDLSTKIVSVSESKLVKGTNNMAFMRKISGRLELTATPSGEFELLITSHTEVARPWYAPEGIFLKEVSKKGKEAFEKKINQLATDLASVL